MTSSMFIIWGFVFLIFFFFVFIFIKMKNQCWWYYQEQWYDSWLCVCMFVFVFLFVFVKMKNQRWWYYQCQWCSGSWVRSGKCWKTFCRGYLPLLCTHHTDAVFVFVQMWYGCCICICTNMIWLLYLYLCKYDMDAVFVFVQIWYGCCICICAPIIQMLYFCKFDRYAVFAFVRPSYGCCICICTFSNMKKIMFTKTSWAAYCYCFTKTLCSWIWASSQL